MPALSLPQPLLLAAAGRLPVVLLAGGCLHGCLVRMVEAVAGGAPSLTLGLSPFELITLAVAVRLLWTAPASTSPAPTIGWPEALVLLALLLPSSAVAWVAVAGYAAVQAHRSDGQSRTGALLILALAACALWSGTALKWLAQPVTSAEAWLVGQLVGLARPDLVQTANVIGDPAGHSLILLTACTTANGLPLALLAMLSVALVLGGIDRRKLTLATLVLVGLYATANLLRLAAMAWSGDLYDAVHGPVGANLYDAWQTVLVLACGNWMARA